MIKISSEDLEIRAFSWKVIVKWVSDKYGESWAHFVQDSIW